MDTVSRSEFNALIAKYNDVLQKLDGDRGVAATNYKAELAVSGQNGFRLVNTTVSSRYPKGFALAVTVDGKRYMVMPYQPVVVPGTNAQVVGLQQRGLLTVTAL